MRTGLFLKYTGVSALVLVFTVTIFFVVSKKEEREEEYEKEEAESGADKQMDRWLQSRGYPDATFMTAKWMKAWEKAQAMKERDAPNRIAEGSTNVIETSTGNWTAVGPKVFGGRILCLAFDPSNPDVIYAGSASGGLWKTTTGGTGATAWSPVPMNFPVLGISSILIHPTNSNIIYAATGEVYRVTTGGSNNGRNVWKARGTYGVGILKSTNGGTTWTQVFNKNMSDMFGVQRLLFNPRDPNKIYAATTDGLYRTIDAGATWHQVSSKVNVRDVAVNFNDTAQVVMSVGNLVDTDKGIYRSTNSGASFILSNPTGLVPTAFRGYANFANIPNAVSGNTLYASIDCGHDFYTRTPATSTPELFRSTDFGNTWSTISNSFHRSYQYWFCEGLAINPNSTSQLVMGGVNYFSISIAGTTGTSTTIATGSASTGFLLPGQQDGSNTYVHADAHQIIYHPTVANRFYIACDGGVFRTSDNGATFESCNGGLQVQQFYGNAGQSNTDANLFVGGLQDNGIAIYRGNATGWRNHPFGDGAMCVIDQTNNNFIYIGGDARRVSRSSNGGTSFTNLLTYAARDARTGFIAPMALSPSNNGVFYIASDNLHRNGAIRTATTASGQFTNSTGTQGPTLGTNYIAGAQRRTAVSMGVSFTNANKLYISTSPFSQNDNVDGNDGVTVSGTTGMFRVDNASAAPYAYTDIKGTLPDRLVLDIAVSPTNDNTVYVTLGGYGSSHVYRTTDGGVNWTNIDNGQLPDVPTSAILIDPNNANVLYVGNDLGVYVSPNGGTNWYDFNFGLWDATQVFDLVSVPSTSRIRAVTHGKGVFESPFYSGTLPVRTINLSGNNKGAVNHIEWNVTGEENVKDFTLERSDDGIRFNTVTTVAARGGSGNNTYSYQDAFGNSSGTVYYRIKIEDNDGSIVYSRIIAVAIPVNRYSLKVLSTVFNSSFTVQVNVPDNATINMQLFDIQGRLYFTRNAKLQSGLNILPVNDLPSMPPGTYILKSMIDKEKFAVKLIKQ